MKDKGLVKSVNFVDHKYVGDPLNAVKIFNEKEVDELVFIDIDASAKNQEPDLSLVAKLAAECRMPLCYGGGIKTVQQAQDILNLGVEKIAISSSFFSDENLILQLVRQVGSQSVVIVLDAKKKRFSKSYECFIHNASVNTKACPIESAIRAEQLGVGEIIINSIDNDGKMTGYNFDLIHKVKSKISVPVTALGGAGSYDDIKELVSREGLIGSAAGSLFVFKGKYRAVLINYPSGPEKNRLLD